MFVLLALTPMKFKCNELPSLKQKSWSKPDDSRTQHASVAKDHIKDSVLPERSKIDKEKHQASVLAKRKSVSVAYSL